jgi:hypothetical protein
MTEAERLRAQASRCLQLAADITDNITAATLRGLATKSLEQAKTLEREQAGRAYEPSGLDHVYEMVWSGK